jgi:hypothetical protein
MFDMYNELRDKAKTELGEAVYNQLLPGFFYKEIADKFYCCYDSAARIIRTQLKRNNS